MAKITLNLNHEIKLKQLGLEDAKLIVDIVKSKNNYLKNWIDSSVPLKTIDDAKMFLLRELKRIELQHEFLFTASDSQGLIGIVGFYNTNIVNNKTDLVLWIENRAKTPLYFITMIEALLKFGFDDLKVNRIQAKAVTSDFALIAALKKQAMIFEGNERAGLMEKKDTYHNLAIYSILKNDYRLFMQYYLRATKVFQRKTKKD
jgi:ribosomal-protein-serine acetyltransferase